MILSSADVNNLPITAEGYLGCRWTRRRGFSRLEANGVFTLEAEMKAPVRRWLANKGMYVAEEFATGWGICDLVGCRFDHEQVAYRTEQGQRQPLGSAQTVLIYNQLPDVAESHRGITRRALEARLAPYISRARIERALERLVATNHVSVTRSGSFQKVNGWAPLHSRLVAVELKLNRLTEVLEQARANRAFVPESFIALPFEVARRAVKSSFVDVLVREGVGLLSVSPSSCRTLLHASPSPNWLEESLELWVVENFWRVYRGRH